MNTKQQVQRFLLSGYFLAPIALILSVWAFYYPSLSYAFQFDDLANIVKFFDIRHKTFFELFCASSRWVSLWLNTCYYALGQFDPFYYRLGGVFFHMITGLCVFMFCLLAYGRRVQTTHTRTKQGSIEEVESSWYAQHALLLAYVTASLFLLHPVQTQTVSYVIQGQLEGLATLGMLIELLIFLALLNAQSSRAAWGWRILFFALMPFVTSTKEIVIVLPALVLLTDWFFGARGSWRQLRSRWKFHALCWISVLGFIVYYLRPEFFWGILGLKAALRSNIGNALTERPEELIRPIPFLMSQFKVIVHYLWIFIWPASLSVEYDWKLSKAWYAPDVLLPLALLCTLAYIVLRRLRRDPRDVFSFGILWFFVVTLPRASIIPSTELMSDYKTYPASLGLFMIMGIALVRGMQWLTANMMHAHRARTVVGHACVVAVLMSYGAGTTFRNMVWRSGKDFWGNVLENAPGKARAYNNYGVALCEAQEYGSAIVQFQKAMAMDAHYPDPCNNLAVAYGATGQIDKAIEAIRYSIKMQPRYPEGYNNIASFYLQKKDYANAEASLRTALTLRPHYGKAYFNLGRMYLEQGNKERAWEAFRDACTRADFDTQEVGWRAYASVSMDTERYDHAAHAITRLLNFVQPSQTEDTRFMLGSAYYFGKQFAQARQVFEQVVQQNPKNFRALFNLGETQLALNDVSAAHKTYERVAQITDQLPVARLRIAHCLSHLGRADEARVALRTLVDGAAPDQVKSMARVALGDLDKGARAAAARNGIPA